MNKLLFAFVMLAQIAFAHEGHDHAGPAPSGNAERVELGASIAVTAAGRFFVVSKESAGAGIGYAVVRSSSDVGKTWSAPVRVNSVAEPVAADGDSRPKLALGEGEEVYVTWTKPLSKPYTGDVRFSRSTDGGKTFSAPITLHRDRREITHRFDSVAVDKAGNLYVAWIDKRDQEDAKKSGKPYRGAAVYMAISKDHGATFQPDFKLADYSCECCRIALAADAKRGLWVFWRHVFEPSIRDHALAQIDEQGTIKFVRRATFDEWNLAACPHQGPSIAQDGAGTLHAVWFTQGKNPGVQYGRLLDGRVAGQRTLGSPTAAYADIAAYGKRITIVWKDYDGTATRLLVSVSADAGETWTESVLMKTTNASDQPRVLQRNGRFFVFWNTQETPFKLIELDERGGVL